MSKPALEDLFTFEGRRNRQSFIFANLAFYGACIGGFFLVMMMSAILGDFGAIVSVILFFGLVIAVSVATFAVTAQRLHDIGQTGWISLLYFVPIACFVMPIWLCFAEGDHGFNDFGPDPLDDSPSDIVGPTPRGGVISRG